MSCTSRSSICSVLTAKDLEAFVDAYKIPEHFPPTLSGPDESAEFTHDRIVIYTLSFSSCGVCYPLSAFKVDLLRHFGVHFSQLHPLGFMRVVHFELSCVAVFGEPSVPLFCMFYKLISDGDWCTFAKRKDSVSPPCYSFMPTSTYPKVWKSRFIFVSAAMMLESPPLRDPKAAIEDSVPVLSANEIVQWKRVLENPTRAFTFPEGVLAMGGLSPFYSVWPKTFIGKKGVEKKVLEGSVQAGDSAIEGKDEEGSSDGKKDSQGSLRVKSSSNDEDDEDLETRLSRKQKVAQTSSPKVAPVPRNIRLRLRSASNQKTFPATKASSELHPAGVKGSLSKHLRSSSLISEPLLGSSKASIEIPTAPSSSRVRDKTPEISAARITPTFNVSPLHATGTSKPSHPEGLVSQSLCKGFFRGAGMLQLMDELRRENEGLRIDLKTSQTVAAELRCQVTDAERRLLEEKGAGVMLEQKELVWERERMA
ncbi:hypothetical protein HanRHA438_Chr17g0832021 [Helianthus annuus]|uniref:Transposase (putative) gypsy type domain-containing protein n=1 Tax=Helianthus annuus TaxID=4232 RepID=A0A9K3DMX7_HELAN|nr:hypothetical protein HanXRQr2_Chr17g0822101 [Helianthus annuus]KAJ0430484.1 hypothetical protein HanHA300_Chr17g0669601 [Helianthus annuus]KAJ0435355.1 hypothetical protein HanIR_Chr17g0892421 [Helianthus annuus]KAJ0448908.1 hypothetical protein HanHA89_Chr17g0722401 [Helianthus annuus]KAJ0827981.1 hypothetical protein HanRHA438_Chr17g0832021 [Helianthus annuus]